MTKAKVGGKTGRRELIGRSIAFLVVSLYKGDGTAIAYFVFMPKVHVLCMLLGVNSRVSIARELNISSGPYVRHLCLLRTPPQISS